MLMYHSACVHGHRDIHHHSKAVLNSHLEWVDEDLTWLNRYPLETTKSLNLVFSLTNR